jgi:hypothetical protein
MKEKHTLKQMINSSSKDECVDNKGKVVNQENTLSEETSVTL